MASDTETKEEPPVVGKAGDSMWKENLFAGGFPGGEQFFKAWIEDGMKANVPDMPNKLQPTSAFVPVDETKTGVLAKLDATEFFKGLESTEPDVDADVDEADDTSSGDPISASRTLLADEILDYLAIEVPDESLYAPYFPKETRFLAPDIIIDYEYKKNSPYDRVGLAMTEVTASPTQVYYPKESVNKAPVITLNYPENSPTSAYVKVSMQEIEPLPALGPPPKKGEIVTTLVPGNSGGLKLNFEEYIG